MKKAIVANYGGGYFGYEDPDTGEAIAQAGPVDTSRNSTLQARDNDVAAQLAERGYLAETEKEWGNRVLRRR